MFTDCHEREKIWLLQYLLDKIKPLPSIYDFDEYLLRNYQ